MKKVCQLAWVFVLSGCLASGPEEVELIIKDEAASELVRGIASNDFLIYSVTREQVNALTNVYADYVKTKKFQANGDYRQYEAFVRSIISPNLKAFFTAHLPPAVQKIDYTEAEIQYQSDLGELKSKIAQDNLMLADLDNDLAKIRKFNADLETKLAGIQKLKEGAHEKLHSISERFFRKLENFNTLWPNMSTNPSSLSLEAFQFIFTSKSVCYSSFRQYEIVHYTHGRCFVKKLPSQFNKTHPLYKEYESAFKSYINEKAFLSLNNPMIKGTFEEIQYEVTHDVLTARNEYAATHGTEQSILDKRAQSILDSNRNKYAYDSMVANKFRHINTLLSGEIDEVKAILDEGINLSNSNSSLYQTAMYSMNAIHSKTLDSHFRAPFSSDSMMLIAQVNAENRQKFPIFVKPTIINQRELADMDTFPLIFSHGNIEHVSPNGVVHTLVFMVGEAFLGWKETD